MSKMIDFGIDLGTTNSLIAKFNAGKVQVFKNPRGHKEGLPSVVGFRKDKILVGDKARDYAAKDPQNVKSRFKRKMGTSETFKIESLSLSKSPEELSAFVLKELKTFVQSGENVDSAVITIPASFDTIQSNSTKEAGTLAGLKQVLLLQEPIAASLAYANSNASIELINSQWIVYDLGGGTFDVALVKIVEGELTVIDHEGDNFLGGTDFDALIVEKIVIPHIEKEGSFQNLAGEMKSSSGKYEKEWYRLLDAAETAKIELSADTSTEIEFQLEDDDGNDIDGIVTITRSQFESIIKDRIVATSDMLKAILTRQSLQPSDLKFVLMVGGSTYIPYVRQLIEELMNIPVNTDIDPTNAIAIGAAYFAGTRTKSIENLSDTKIPKSINVKVTYSSSSQEDEELFAAKVEGAVSGFTYRIHRDDGGFDSGTKEIGKRITEDLPLREGEFNIFQFKIYDSQGNEVDHDEQTIQIAQGRYSVAGQVIPEALSLVKDDLATNDTKLDLLFERNCVLPSRVKRTVEVARTFTKGCAEGPLRIMVVEGPSNNHALSNKQIGVLEISGDMISRDLLKGTEIDITVEISESRDLTISAYLNGTDQEFSQIFNPKKRNVSPKSLGAEIIQLEETIQNEKQSLGDNSSQSDKELSALLSDVQQLIIEAGQLSEDSITDDKFKLEDKKREVAQKLHHVSSSMRLETSRVEYKAVKADIGELISEAGNASEKQAFSEITRREEVFLKSNNYLTIDSATEEIRTLGNKILFRTPAFILNMFEYLVEQRSSMIDQSQASALIKTGQQLASNEEWEDLMVVNSRLWEQMPIDQSEVDQQRFVTGIL
tara:strand:- start:846 stop:3332 length:2487 start_codon:yes stop_codon:yes gene_type:complete